jgi:beta-glucosidase
MGQAAIRGLQGDTLASPYSVAACLKHFAGYSMPLSGKDRTPAWIPERELREYFLPPFAAAFGAGAATTMINSGDISGTPVHVDSFMLQQVLRREMGFKGLAVTDWEDIYKLSDIHRVAANRKEAVRMAIEAGIDMSMTPNDFQFNDLLLGLVKEGRIPESRLDVSVKRILLLKRELGLFEQTMFPDTFYKAFGSEKHRELSYRAAVASITLLKNDSNTLPLENSRQRWAICGPGAHSMHLLNGGWSRSWQGTDTTYRHDGRKTIAQAMQDNLGDQLRVLPAFPDATLLKKTMRAAEGIIVCLAEKPGTEIPGNIDALDLPADQKKLVADALSFGKPVVLVCTFNRPLIITEEVEKAAAVLYTYLPGDEGGRATANILCGKASPGGRLPFTYPRSSGDIVHYDRKHTENMYSDFSANGYRPLFDFAHGLSYLTHVAYAVKVSDSVLNDSNFIQLQFTVLHSGRLSGQLTVPVYCSRAYASITPPVKKLIRFVTVEREPGHSNQTFAFALRKSDFSFINRRMERVSEPGPVTLQVGDFTKQIIIR